MKNPFNIIIYKSNGTWRVISRITNVYIAQTFEEACKFAKTITFDNVWDLNVKT